MYLGLAGGRRGGGRRGRGRRGRRGRRTIILNFCGRRHVEGTRGKHGVHVEGTRGKEGDGRCARSGTRAFIEIQCKIRQKHNVSTDWLALPHSQRFDWTKGFCVSLGLVIWAVLHWGVVASLCATAPTSPNTAARSRCFRDLCVARGAPARQWPPNPGAAAAIFSEPGARFGWFCAGFGSLAPDS